jgi:TRAP-type C4-dicarboxylate transport system permease small subunit
LYAGSFLAAPWVLRQGAHVRVDAVLTALPKRYAVRMEQLVDFVGLGVALVLVVYGALAVIDAWAGNLVARKTWNFDEWLLLLPIPISGVLLAAEFVLRVARVRGVVADDYDPAKRASL